MDRLDRGDRVVLIRKLEIRWRLPEESIDTEGAVARLAADMIAALEPAWATPIEPPDPDANLVIFPDAASWWSDALQARAAGRLAWYHQPVLDPEPLLALSEPAQRVLALSVLGHLGRRAPEVLRGSPPDALRACAGALHVLVPDVLGRIASQRAYAVGHARPELLALLHQIHAASGPDPAPALLGLGALALRLAQAPPSVPLEAEALAFVQALASAKSWVLAAHAASAEAKHPELPEMPAASEASAEVQTVPVEPDRAVLEGPAPLLAASSYAGLFYLVPLLLELGAGEHLWQICLPEGQLLGWAAAGLVGDDPVVTWLAGRDVSEPAVTAAQADEVMTKGCVELARALPRRRPDLVVPPLELFLGGEELAATLPGSVFPIWSAVCSGASDLRAAGTALSECWPARLSIPPALDGLGPRSRVQVQSEQTPRVLFRREGAEPAARLARAVIGAAAALFEWRIEEPCEASVAAFVERWLKVPGRLEDTGDTLIVHLRVKDVSFPVRRAGLDRDPGYLPWLQRMVLLRFDGDEPEGDGLPIVGEQASD